MGVSLESHTEDLILPHQYTMSRINTGRIGGRNSRGNVIDDEGFSFLSALKLAAGGGFTSGTGGNPVWVVTWFFALWFVAFPLAGFCATWYIFLIPFTVCFDG